MIEEGQHLTNLVLKSIAVTGFRGSTRPIEIDLSRNANFLIGRNGTGKTTLINIISDSLLCRYQSLMAAPFEAILITFWNSDKRHRPSLSIKKEYDDYGDVIALVYSFTDYKTKGPSFNYSIKSRLYRRNDDFAGSAAQRRIIEEFSKRFRLTWLALNRSLGISKPSGESTNDLDARLEHSFSRLGTFFTRLDSKFSEELQKFQQEWFMSLLVSSKRESALNIAQSLDVEEEGRQIREMLSGIGIKSHHYSAKVERHVQTIKRLSEPNSDKHLRENPIEYIADTYDIAKLHFWVEQWAELQKTKEEIYRTREKFISIANGMLYKKIIIVDSGNRISVKKSDFNPTKKTSSADILQKRRDVMSGIIVQPGEIRYSDLSSGEKQLLIFLSETVLRSEEPYIFIADEPELSLHIEWQEKLVPVILELSPQAQVFFATHSPDIVSRYKDNVYSMERLAS
ncbi:AAA family ATPase [Agrobacterium vitis]|uniref:AAA family ATPase n=1 Tax=Agrobacterium vitis TaxID=373 RepID=UPI0015DBBAE2|nr:AAA family ATPase [Agrobacterium vitis]MCF1451365.1 AAA family ATPase [Agrobacterium vitis]